MKLPYLVMDVAALWVISKVMKDSPDKNSLLLLWLFHPVNLFSSYIFGAYRILSALTLWILIYFLSCGKKRTACLTLGALCLMDSFPFLLILPMAWILGKGWKGKIKMICWSLLPVAVVLGIFLLHSGHWVLFPYYSPIVARESLAGIMRHYPKIVGTAGKLIFLTGYAGAMLDLIRKKKILEDLNARRITDFFVYVGAMILFLLFATSRIAAHYFMWLLPLLIYIRSTKDPWPPGLSSGLILLLFLFSLDSRQLNLGLFAPLSPDNAVLWPSLHDCMDRYLPWGRVVALARLGFSFLCLLSAGRLYLRKLKSFDGN